MGGKHSKESKQSKKRISNKIEHVKEVKSLAKSNDQFSKSFYDLLRKEEGNLIMSPFSVSGVMAMVSGECWSKRKHPGPDHVWPLLPIP